MNLLKPLFVGVLITWLALLGIYGLVQLAGAATPMLSWLGLVLSALAPLAYITGSYSLKPPRTPGPAIVYSILCGLGLAITMAMSFRYGPVAGLTHVWAGIALAGWAAWLRWFSANRVK